MKIGSTTIADCKIGSTQVNKIYIGSTQIWQKAASYDADFQAKLDRATALGYALPTGSFLTAENALYLNLKNPSLLGLSSGNLYTKTQEGILHATNGDANYARIRTKTPTDALATLVNSPTFDSEDGYTGNGTSSYINYGAPSGIYTEDSAFALTIVRDWGTNRDSVCLNGQSGASNALYFRLSVPRMHTNTSQSTFNTMGNATRAAKSIIATSRTADAACGYGETLDLTQITPTVNYFSGTTNGNFVPTTLYSLAVNGVSAFSTGTVGGSFWGSGLTEQELKDYMVIIKTYLKAVGW